MKKIFPLFLTLILIFSLTVMANADDNGKVVGDDIEIGEDEVKIISIEEPDEYSEGDKDSESGLIAAPVVGDDISIGDGEAKIISIDDQEDASGKKSSLPLAAGISFGVAAAAYLLMKVRGKI